MIFIVEGCLQACESITIQILQRHTHHAQQHFVDHRTETPHIDRVRVWITQQYFRSQIFGSPAEGESRFNAIRQDIASCAYAVASAEHSILEPRRRGYSTVLAARRVVWTIELLAETEIRENNMAIRSQQNVLRLEIAVYDSSSMQTFETFDDLSSVEAGTIFAQSAPSGQLCS